MVQHTISIKNNTSKSQSYVLFSDELFILESTKHVIVIPKVEPGKSGQITIDSTPRVWAKVASTSEPVFAEIEVGSILLIEAVGCEPVIKKVVGTPTEEGCFAIATRENFKGIFGLAISTPAGLLSITAKQAAGAATYQVEPDNSFHIAVNKKYKTGDELRDDCSVAIQTKVTFPEGVNDVTVNHYGAVAETVRTGDEGDECRGPGEELMAKDEVINKTLEMISLLTTNTLDQPAIMEKAHDLGISLGWSEQQKFDFDHKLTAHMKHLLDQQNAVKTTTDENRVPGDQLAKSHEDAKQLKASYQRLENDIDLNTRITSLQAKLQAARSHTSSPYASTRPVATNLNVLDASGEFPLYSVAAGGNYAETKRLLELGANASMRTLYQWTALHWAVNNGHTSVVQLLLSYGADVNAVSDTGKTPLSMAKTDAMRQLLLGRRY